MDPYDRRQLESMRDQLDAYDSRRIDLDALIKSVEALLGLAGDLPEPWLDEFRQNWGLLEEVYSVAVVREQPIDNPENSRLLAPGLARMREMLADVLER